MEKERKLILGNGEAHFPGRFMWYSMPAFNSMCQVCRGWWQGMFYLLMRGLSSQWLWPSLMHRKPWQQSKELSPTSICRCFFPDLFITHAQLPEQFRVNGKSFVFGNLSFSFGFLGELRTTKDSSWLNSKAKDQCTTVMNTGQWQTIQSQTHQCSW